MRSALSFFALAAGCLIGLPQAASAQDIGHSSSGTVSISVTIQPLGGAVFAQENYGAVGLWTFTGRNPGLMLSAPSLVTAGDVTEVSLFAQSTQRLTIRGAGISTGPIAGAPVKGGLNRRSFALQAAQSPIDFAGRNSQLFIIGTI